MFFSKTLNKLDNGYSLRGYGEVFNSQTLALIHYAPFSKSALIRFLSLKINKGKFPFVNKQRAAKQSGFNCDQILNVAVEDAT